jgi:hypothetical protein
MKRTPVFGLLRIQSVCPLPVIFKILAEEQSGDFFQVTLSEYPLHPGIRASPASFFQGTA